MSDVEEDELEALRAAALASLKSRADKSSLTSSAESNHIAQINTVVASNNKYTSYTGAYKAAEQSSYSNQYSWRNPTQASRRTRGNRTFPKVSQRSNLIVITPVNTEGKNSEEKDSTTQLVLPQHKWCQFTNEDSSSPKTYRRTGPTRFNRHESGSESSDSDYENSENDSYSNETILQDEPSDHFTGRSGESIGDESSPEKPVSERRLSFQNIDSDLNVEGFQGTESTSVYKCLKTTYPNLSSDDKSAILRSPSVEKDSEHSWKHDSHRSYSYRQYDSATAEIQHSEQKDCSHSAKPQTVNGDSPPKKHRLSSVLSHETDSSRSSRKYIEASKENGSHDDLNSKRNLSNNNPSKLCENDLRLELKKRMHGFQSRIEQSRKNSDSPNSQSPVRSCSRDRFPLRSSQSRDCSESKNHVHGYSSSQKHARSRSQSANGHHSESPHRNHSRRWSRSPEKHSFDRHRKRNHSQSPVRSRKRNRSRSTQRKRDRNSSLDRKRKQSHSRDRKSNRSSRYRRGHSHTSSSSSSSSTSTSSSNSSLPLRSVSSVIKPAQPKDVDVKQEKAVVSKGKRTSSSESDTQLSPKKSKKLDENNSVSSNVKSSVYCGENKNNASDSNKRVPVHMRLGSLPGKRVIQMTKDVEAAFVNTSSDDADEDVNMRHKKDNFQIVCDINDNNSKESSKRHFQRNSFRSMDASKDRRLKHHR